MIFVEPDGATPLDLDEMEGLKHPHVTTRAQLDELEDANIQEGQAWLARRLRRRVDVLAEDFVRELHRRLFGDVWSWAGTFRKTEKNIGVDPFQIPMQLRMLLDNARYWHQHGTYPEPLEAGARFHHRMVQIHPFPNGNGRHARAAADAYMLRLFGRARIDWTAGQSLQVDNERRQQYLAALRAADGYDFDPLLKFVGARR
jgi:Fic-DOC domain mobile mystery protein B